MLFSELFSGLFILWGLACVWYGLRSTPQNHLPVRLWRVGFMLMGLSLASLGSFTALNYALRPIGLPAQTTPALGWTLWVLGYLGLVGYLVALMMMWLVSRARQGQLTQREPPHNA